MAELTLQSGPFSVGVLPAIGGAISHFRSRSASGDIEWMRPWVERGRGPLDTASFVTVPFFSWLERDRFQFGKRFVDLQPSGLGFDRCLLGLGWTSAWKVEEATRDRIVLSHENPGGSWPWHYRAEQTLELDAEGLVIDVTLRNDDEEPMPGGLGLHPYFPWPEKLSARTGAMHVMSEAGLPISADPDHRAVVAMRNGAAPVPGLDNLFERWDGLARLSWGNRHLNIEADAAYGFLCVNSTSPDRSYCCVEPVTHTTNALHRPVVPWGETGFKLIAPGESFRAVARFRPVIIP